MEEIDRLSYTPLYVQLADLIAGQIERGELEHGQPLPSEEHLRQTHGLARGTVRAAVRLLSERGLVRTLQGRGTYVMPPDER
jgi:DNA-binding GntR family transcriptional regulator